MFSFNIDLGQLLISGLIAVVGWFVKRTIDKLERRMDRGEDAIFNLHGDMQTIMGHLGVERRKIPRRFPEE